MDQSISSEQAVKVGIFSILAIVAAIYGILWLKDFKLKPAYSFYIRFHEPKTLTKGIPVDFRGVKVGRVSDIHLAKDFQSTLIKIDILEEGLYLPIELIAKIKDASLIGKPYISLITGTDLSGEIIKANQIIRGEHSSDVAAIEEQLSELLSVINSLLDQSEVIDDLHSVLSNAKNTMHKIDCFTDKADYILSKKRPAFKMFFGNPGRDFTCRADHE